MGLIGNGRRIDHSDCLSVACGLGCQIAQPLILCCSFGDECHPVAIFGLVDCIINERSDAYDVPEYGANCTPTGTVDQETIDRSRAL